MKEVTYFARASSNVSGHQHQISPCNINACSTDKVMRIKDMNTQGEFSCFFYKTSPHYFYKKNMGQDKRVCSLILRVIGTRPKHGH